MNFLLRLFPIFWLSSVLLTPLFKLISPTKQEWTILALVCTSILVSVIIVLLLEIKDALNESNKNK